MQITGDEFEKGGREQIKEKGCLNMYTEAITIYVVSITIQIL